MTVVQGQYVPATILIIDDAHENRILLKSQLVSGNYRVLTAASGEEGIRMALEHREELDLILLDVMMPGISGFDVSKTLKEDPQTANIPIIIVTALREVTYRIKGIESGADEFLSRPHNREELLVRVKSLVQLKRARERLEDERDHLELLYNVSQATMSHDDVSEVITSIITHTQEAVGATKGVIMVTDMMGDVTNKILVRAKSGAHQRDTVTSRVIREGFAGWLLRKGQGDIILSTEDDDRWIALADDDEAGSAIGVPLIKADGKTLGLVILSHPKRNHFKSSHLALLTAIGQQVATSIENARLYILANEERRKLSSILEQSNDSVITTDEAHCITLLNRAAEAMFDVQEKEVVGKYVLDIRELKPIQHLFRQDNDRPTNDEIGLHTGPILSASVTKIANIGSVVVMQDITERRMREAQQIEIQRSKLERERDEWRKTMGRYISPSLLENYFPKQDEPFDVDQLFKRRQGFAVVLFADMRNSTKMIADLSAHVAIEVMQDFFNTMSKIIHANNGTIFDFIGDELEVGFNVPIHQENAVQLAIKTACEMQIAFGKLRGKGYSARSTVEIGLGIGIDQGEVAIGNLGSADRWHFAIVGEAVNNAHHLVKQASDSEIVISKSVWTQLGKDEEEMAYMFKKTRVKLKDINEECVHVYKASVPHEIPEHS